MSDDAIDSMPFGPYEAARMEEPPDDCPWDCRQPWCDHAGLCPCGATNLRPVPQRCRVCGRPMKLRSVS